METKTTIFSIGERQSVFDSAGQVMNETKATKYSELVWGIISDAFRHSNEDSAHIPPEKSLMDFFREKVKEKDVTVDEQNILLQMAQMWGAFVGDPIEKQSLKFFWLEECIEGGAPSSFTQRCVAVVNNTQRICSSPAHTKRSLTVWRKRPWRMPTSGSPAP